MGVNGCGYCIEEFVYVCGVGGGYLMGGWFGGC